MLLTYTAKPFLNNTLNQQVFTQTERDSVLLTETTRALLDTTTSTQDVDKVAFQVLNNQVSQEIYPPFQLDSSSANIDESVLISTKKSTKAGIKINDFDRIHKTFSSSDEGPKNKPLEKDLHKLKGRRSSPISYHPLTNPYHPLSGFSEEKELLKKEDAHASNHITITSRLHSPNSKNSTDPSPRISPKRSPRLSPKRSPKEKSTHSPLTSPGRINSKSLNILLPKELIVGHDDFNKFREAKPLNLKDYIFIESRKFDKNILIKLREILKNVPLISAVSLQNEAFVFCREAIKALFKNEYTLDKYAEYGYERTNLLLSIIQNGGLLVKNLLPSLVQLRNCVANYLTEQKQKSEFSEDLYIFLQELTKIDNFGDDSWGKNLSDFITTLDHILEWGRSKNLHEINGSSKDHKSKVLTYDPYVLRDLILHAIGGQAIVESFKEGSNTNALNIINAIKLWVKPNNGEHPVLFKTLQAHCDKIAMLCAKVNNLSNVEYHCFVEHLYPVDMPNKNDISFASPRFFSQARIGIENSSKTPPIYNLKWQKLYPTSYSADATNKVFKGLFEDRKILQTKITVNNSTFF
ncbi:MAG: hypothetical protein H0W50_03710 [Parachlamydiaceae bacterium]|nr:hypothetical protein [Parachlamydiaceae bacterium]